MLDLERAAHIAAIVSAAIVVFAFVNSIVGGRKKQ